MSILLYGDPHRRFEPLVEAAREHRPEHVVILGDLELDAPLEEKLATLVRDGVAIHWIHGNHDAHSPEMHDFLFDAPGGIHGRSVRLETTGGSLTLAGLGGHYRGRVWFPKNGDEPGRWNTREAFLHDHGRGGRYRGGLPLGQRQTIFPEDHAALAALDNVDVLITHEAPTSVGADMGFGAIDNLARDMKVGLVVHGHHHRTYDGATRDGIPVRGLDGAEVALLDPATRVVRTLSTRDTARSA